MSAVAAGFRVIAAELREHLRLDRYAMILIALMLIQYGPLIARSTESPQKLAAYSNDEPLQTIALEGMTARPLGNPANFMFSPRNSPKLPEHWGEIRYSYVVYYGGAYPGLGFLLFEPLHLAGVPTFPAAPLILRFLSAAAGALALLVLYNFGRQHVNALAGFLAALYLMANDGFFYYASIIHPDTLMLLFAFVGLALAVRHAGRGDLGSLIAYGLLAGLVQGTKGGGAWMIPLGFATAYWGCAYGQAAVARHAIAAALVKRMLVMGVAAAAAYVVSTPYILFDPEFFDALRIAAGIIGGREYGGNIGLDDWLVRAAQHLGPVVGTLALGGMAIAAREAGAGRKNPALLFAAILALSQLFWYGMLVRLWVNLPYLIAAIGCCALLAGYCASFLLQRIRSRLPSAALPGAVLIAALVAVVALDRWYPVTRYILRENLRERSTVIEIDRWAKQNLAPDSRIIFDDTAYFDRKSFPRARMHGGILTWKQLERYRPDYLVLSSDLHGAPHVQEQIRTQRLEREDENPYSVRLYQDLLPLDRPDAAPVVRIWFMRDIAPDPAEKNDRRDRRGKVERFAIQAAQIAIMGRMLWGADPRLIGPTLKIYRVVWPRPLSSAPLTGYSAEYAFQNTPNAWVAEPKGKAAIGTYIGLDFGAGLAQAVRRVRITWVTPLALPRRIRIEHSDDAVLWTDAGTFDVGLPTTPTALRWQEDFPVAPPRALRYYRVVAVEMDENNFFGVDEIQFLER